MRIVFFTHPSFLGSQSMPRFAGMLAQGMKERGHEIEVWTPAAKLFNLPLPGSLKKWMGYIDQYALFPALIRKKLKSFPSNTLFVFTDQALGPWVPLVANRPHVIHCHDFLAQFSALDKIPENPTSSSGKIYQKYIRKGYQQGRNFISVSKKTQEDLHLMLGKVPSLSEVVYNGLNQEFKVDDVHAVRAFISNETNINVSDGYLLHVGGNQWYKNRTGVIEIYNAWRDTYKTNLPLIFIGATPNSKLLNSYTNSPYKEDIHFLVGKNDMFVKKAYCGASVFLFPSLAEGFGWPIAEAMSSGCPVITTGEAPMTEVGGSATRYISRKPYQSNNNNWAEKAAGVINTLLNLSVAERNQVIELGVKQAQKFDPLIAHDTIERIYQHILADNV
jgi:glycosyltransferase involved in cell wall biosynthesis